MNTPYDDIIHLPHPTSKKYPRMSQQARAAQFAPFAALTGYDDAVREKARLTDRRIELNEDETAVLNERLQRTQEHIKEHPEIRFTCFVPDERKAGGAYVEITGMVKKIDTVNQLVLLTNGTKFPIEDIIEIKRQK